MPPWRQQPAQIVGAIANERPSARPTRRSVSRAIFQPGTVIAEAAADLLVKLSVDLGYDLEAVE